jgi:hypothetical protein
MLPARLREPDRRAPLPDSVAVRRLAVPDAAPPYDDEQPSDVPRSCVDGPDAAEPDSHNAGARVASTAGPPGAAGWPGQFAQVLAETLAGSRPAHQLTPWTTEQARQRIRQLGPMLVTDQRPRVRRIVTSAPSQDVLEMTAVVGFGPRVRALALRLERGQPQPYRTTGERWYCTAIESA